MNFSKIAIKLYTYKKLTRKLLSPNYKHTSSNKP